jgi:hypothetical protein
MERERIHPMQAMLDGWSADWQKQRAETQMTLGKLIKTLEEMPPESEVANLHDAHSYRGYYCDLAFEIGAGTIKAAELLTQCHAAMGQVFCGYKGGDYTMGANTPLWIASYGDCGRKLMAVPADGSVETAEDD